MKNLPDKIWLSEDRTMWLHNPYSTEYTEYVRKDAFIEKAVNFLEMLGYGFTITNNITHTNYDKEQLVEDFKNYMKGE